MVYFCTAVLTSSVFGVVYSDLILGLVEKAAGNLHQAFECFSRATHRARTELGSGSYAEAMVGIFEAEIHYEWNEVDRAEALLQHHQQIIEECGLVVHEMTLRLHLARVAVARGRWDEALVILERAERKGMQTRYRRLFASAIHERVRLLLRRGDVHSARLVLAARGLDEQTMTLWTPGHPARELELLALARLLVAEQRPEAALRLLDPICGHLRQSGRNRRLAQMRAVAAVASFRAGDGLAALAAIVDTIGLCVQQGAIRSLVDEGDGLQEVIAFSRSRIPSWQGDGEIARFIGKLVADSDNRISAQQTQQNRHALRFSAREHEVARLLGQGFKNRELANSLAMAPDTVKWHLKNIFGKLGVSSRTQAVLRLQELGIADLPSHASGPPAA